MFFRRRKPVQSSPAASSDNTLTSAAVGDPLRYELEHKFLPSMLADPKDHIFLIGELLTKKGAAMVNFYEMIHMFNAESHYECPYAEDNFRVTASGLMAKGGQTALLITIIMPAPERMPLCTTVFIICSRDNSIRRYLTVEKSEGDMYYLCEWLHGKHINHGPATDRNLRSQIRVPD